MRLLVLFLLFSKISIAQDSISIHTRSQSMFIKVNHIDKKIKDTSKIWFDREDFISIKRDTSYTLIYHDCKNDRLHTTDTFHYISTDVNRKKNSVFIIPRSREEQICLNEQLKSLAFQEKDSLLNIVLKEQYKRQLFSSSMFKYFKLSSVQYYQDKYPYIEIKEVFKEKYKKKNLYTSTFTRILVIDGVHYFIYVKSESLKSAKSIASSRRAVCRDFKNLVNNITIIDSKNKECRVPQKQDQ